MPTSSRTRSRPRRLARFSSGLIIVPSLLAGHAAVAVATAPQALAAPAATTQTYTTPGVFLFTVPAGVTAVQVTAVGAAGGNCFNGPGGRGASVTATVPVASGFQVRVQVAGAGAGGGFCAGGGTAGGIGGGGDGGSGGPGGATGGGAGGGASMVSTGTGSPTAVSTLIVAGGGGGGAYARTGGDAGSAGAGGNGGPGGGATSTEGGTAGAAQGAGATNGTAGVAFTGGTGGSGSGGAGGGGGGYFGGGGGGGATSGGYGGAGGGGSSYVKSTAYLVSAAAPTSSAASVTITYPAVAPPSATIASPTAAGTYVIGQSVPTKFSCAEGVGGAGLVSCNDSNDTNTVSGGTGHLDTSSGGFHTYAVTATGSTGLQTTDTISYTVLYPPTVSIASPATGGVYKLGATVATSFTCTEGLGGPGLVSCNDSNGSFNLQNGSGKLDTKTPGAHTYTVTARSDNGLKATETISYEVSRAVVAIRTSAVTMAGGKVKVVVGCSGAQVCRGTLKLVKGRVVVATTSYAAAGGTQKTVPLSVSIAGKSLLRNAPRHRISTTATATVSGGTTARRTIVVKRS